MSEPYKELLLGCGHNRLKQIVVPGRPLEWCGLTTVDINPACNPDIVGDIEKMYLNDDGVVCVGNTLVSRPDYFDEIHAYEVLEHLGQQGDYKSLFYLFEMLWRMLKPGGLVCATTPSRFSPWLWGDPGHRRAILPETLTFLSQPSYTAQCGRTALSDYRNVYRADFDILHSEDNRVTHRFVLQAVKSSRIQNV